jgi:hypothetical protein
MNGRWNGRGNVNEEGAENDRSRGAREPQGEDQSTPPDLYSPGFPATLKKLFRDVMKELTTHSPKPAPRRRTGVTPGSFRQAATPLMGHVVRQQEMPSLGYMWDALEWLSLWDWNELASVNTAYDDLEPVYQNQRLSA